MHDTTKTEALTDALAKAFRMGKSTALVPNVAHMVEAEFASLVLDQVAALSAVEAERDRLAAECEALRADARRVILMCHSALGEELSAWDIDPPLHHVKEAHDACEAWIAAMGGKE